MPEYTREYDNYEYINGFKTCLYFTQQCLDDCLAMALQFIESVMNGMKDAHRKYMLDLEHNLACEIRTTLIHL